MRNLEGKIFLNKSRAIVISSFLTSVGLLSLNNETNAQSSIPAPKIGGKVLEQEMIKFTPQEKVKETFMNLGKDFAEKRKMFDSGEGKIISPNESLTFVKDGLSYFLIHPKTGEKFIATIIRDANQSNILTIELKGKEGSFMFAKGRGMVTDEELVAVLEEFNTGTINFELLNQIGFRFVLTSNGEHSTRTVSGNEEEITPESLSAFMTEFKG